MSAAPALSLRLVHDATPPAGAGERRSREAGQLDPALLKIIEAMAEADCDRVWRDAEPQKS